MQEDSTGLIDAELGETFEQRSLAGSGSTAEDQDVAGIYCEIDVLTSG